jgi:hypothetical protein
MAFWIILGTVAIAPWLIKTISHSDKLVGTPMIIIAMILWRMQYPRKK